MTLKALREFLLTTIVESIFVKDPDPGQDGEISLRQVKEKGTKRGTKAKAKVAKIFEQVTSPPIPIGKEKPNGCDVPLVWGFALHPGLWMQH